MIAARGLGPREQVQLRLPGSATVLARNWTNARGDTLLPVRVPTDTRPGTWTVEVIGTLSGSRIPVPFTVTRK